MDDEEAPSSSSPFGECAECGLALADVAAAEEHVAATHLGLRPFLCPDCPLLAFPTELAARRHQQTEHRRMTDFIVAVHVTHELDERRATLRRILDASRGHRLRRHQKGGGGGKPAQTAAVIAGKRPPHLRKVVVDDVTDDSEEDDGSGGGAARAMQLQHHATSSAISIDNGDMTTQHLLASTVAGGVATAELERFLSSIQHNLLEGLPLAVAASQAATGSTSSHSIMDTSKPVTSLCSSSTASCSSTSSTSSSSSSVPTNSVTTAVPDSNQAMYPPRGPKRNSGQVLLCSGCGQAVSNYLTSLLLHVSIHHLKAVMFRCTLCGKTWHSILNRCKAHVQKHNADMSVVEDYRKEHSEQMRTLVKNCFPKTAKSVIISNEVFEET